MATKTLATNKRARFDYALQDTFTAGLVLHGHEAKSIRNGGASLNGAYVTISESGEAWLTNAAVKLYKHATTVRDYDPNRARKLLLTQSELKQLDQARAQKLVIIPLSIFSGGPNIKLSLATAKPKKLYDKRRDIKKRDTERSENRRFSN